MLQMTLFGGFDHKYLRDNALHKARGAESKYYMMGSDWGVKVFIQPLFMNLNFRREELQTVEGLMASDLWKGIEKQFQVMKYLESVERGPKVFEMIPVYDNDDNCFYPGVTMEHLDHINVWDYYGPDKYRIQRNYNRIKRLLEMRFGDGDFHEYNVVLDVKTKRFKILDVGKIDARVSTEEGRLLVMREKGDWYKQNYLRDMEYERKLKLELEERQRERMARGEGIVGIDVETNHVQRPNFFRDCIIHINIPGLFPIKGDLIDDRAIAKVEAMKLPEPLKAGLKKKRVEQGRFKAFVNKFIAKKDDIHSRKFKQAA